jgi:hypothetical protein
MVVLLTSTVSLGLFGTFSSEFCIARLCPCLILFCSMAEHMLLFDDTIECSECRLWMHFECAKISNKNLPLYKKKDYICIICRDNMIYNKENKPLSNTILFNG